ncbi:uncharacterized protein HKW66_Vig0052250 [Vigna angularis]|uniref:PGG domain-containing protein n=1 Tax=Phaseolus angularis TaxID=3914 RepID=A0A8T0KZZ8_PHAAN|nr:uncharacterized protein HKW66_Vig0052250 [Vigna angularis]
MDILEDKKVEDDDAMRKLYDASMKGCVSTLNQLVQKDPLILSRVSLCPFTETPLHIASLLGYLEFCQVLLRNSPSLATELDSEGRCPLHLASAKGHTEVVKELLITNPEMCLVRDKDDMLPLHFASMRGRVEAMKELIKAKPDSIEMVESGDEDGSALRLCVRYNHFEALKLLVESLRGDSRFLSVKDREDNSLLCLAVKHRQIKIIKYLLAVSEMSPETRNLNRESLIAMETLEQYPRDFRTLSISRQEEASSQSIGVVIVQEDPPQASSSSSSSLTNNDTPQTSAAPSLPRNDLPEASAAPVPSPKMNMSSEQGEDRWSRLERFCRTYLLDEGNWIDKKTREQLMVAATVIATMTFQSVISPPGGVWQGDTTEDGFTCPDYGFCEAGTAVVGYAWSPDFMKFIFFNSCSFFSSLCVMLLLMSGFPLENRVVMWILAILMIAAASCMLLTYMWALGLVSPNHIYYRIRKLGYLLVGTWSLLLALVASVQLSRIAFWIKSRRKKSTNAPL